MARLLSRSNPAMPEGIQLSEALRTRFAQNLGGRRPQYIHRPTGGIASLAAAG